jgi:NADPH-dependent 2,4-dienoyl-CoA reductase/sulfur reductase-like enzyme/nitrite reductase/ring-hydroxylating ferredoxin subunit
MEETMDQSHDGARPDFRAGISSRLLEDGGRLLGRVDDEDVLLVRSGNEFLAVGARCTHYGGPLGDGIVVGETVRCPLHHACFSLRTGEALAAPAFDPVSCWRVERRGDMVLVQDRLPQPSASPAGATGRQDPESVVIVGGGAAGLAAADMLRRQGYGGPVTIISSDDSAPYDRPNLSKDYLVGDMPDDWLPLRSAEFFAEGHVELVLDTAVTAIDLKGCRVLLEHGAPRRYGALLIATGADPVRLPVPGADGPRVHYLRSFKDARMIAERAQQAGHVVVVGASFIGVEVAASLRARGIDVDVVAPERAPLERVMGLELGQLVRRLHESHGVVFHLGRTVARVDDRIVTLSGGDRLEADVVVMGVGVRPAVSLAERAGLTLDRGIAVDEYLETSQPGVFAAGDVARWPDRRSGDRIRVEHWVVAERQGQTAARNMLGLRERFDAVPFFWSQHYDMTIRYVGHAETWDEVRIDGSLDQALENGCAVTYLRGGRRLAVATILRNRDSLDAEAAMEAGEMDGSSR